MIPPIPTSKSKTNFSIDWIVKSSESNALKNGSDCGVSSIDSCTSRYIPMDYDSEIFKALRLPAHFLQHKDIPVNTIPQHQPSLSPSQQSVSPLHFLSQSPPEHQQSGSPTHQQNHQQFTSHDRNNATTQQIVHSAPSPQPAPTEFSISDNNGQSKVPHSQQGPIRPIPFTPLKRMNMQDMQMQEMQTAASLASSMQHSEMVAAQLQLVAALAYRQQQQQHHQPGSAAAVAASMEASKYNAHHQQQMQIAQMLNQQNCDRTTYPMSPWMINRHGRMFPRGYANDFFLHTFRKQKRIRTAFAPLQLLKLEHAFEGNQYVVGTERKALAKNLNLSETQVKVWFQNRRTKHKRLNQEDGGAGDDKVSECRKSMYSNGDADADDIEIDNDDEDSVMGTEIIVQ